MRNKITITKEEYSRLKRGMPGMVFEDETGQHWELGQHIYNYEFEAYYDMEGDILPDPIPIPLTAEILQDWFPDLFRQGISLLPKNQGQEAIIGGDICPVYADVPYVHSLQLLLAGLGLEWRVEL